MGGGEGEEKEGERPCQRFLPLQSNPRDEEEEEEQGILLYQSAQPRM